MNVERFAPESASGSGFARAVLKLSGIRRQLLFRVAWIGLAAILVTTSIAALPVALQQAGTICQKQDCLTFDPVAINQPAPQEALALEQLGLSVGHYSVYQFAFVLLPPLLSFIVAALLFWYPGQDPMARFMAFAFLLWSWLFPPAITYQVVAPSLHRIFDILLLAPYFIAWQLMFFLFPDGRFAPRWAAPVALGRCGLIIAGLLFPESALNEDSWPAGVGFAVNAPVIGLGIYCQFYKYRRGTAERRRQTRWVVRGLTTILLPGFLFIILLSSPPFSRPGLPRLLAYPPFALVVAGVHLSFAAAIFRHRLWNIDVIVNRTLIYGSLTAVVAGLYILVVGALSLLLQGRGSLFLSLLGTGVVAALLQPLHGRLQRAVNRLMYGERDDPYRVLAGLGRRLETTVTPDELLHSVVETVGQALRLPYVAIALAEGDQFKVAAAYSADQPGQGAPTAGGPGLITLPLLHQSGTVGQFIVAPRGPREEFSQADLRLLADIAHQAGVAAQAARLGTALQHSRERLVASREEERRRLRRDLHDGLGPTLASHSFQLEEALELLTTDPLTGAAPDPEAAAALLRDLITQTQAMVVDIRRLIYQLRPPALDELGLRGALRAQAAQLAGAGQGLHITVETMPARLPPLPAAVEVAGYRIALEALTNVVRHARARTCRVCLSLREDRPGGLEVEVVDDGVGMPARPPAGVGLISMRERAEELGGTCVVEARAHGGTRVLARLPFAAAEGT